jgi:hypothetical protein
MDDHLSLLLTFLPSFLPSLLVCFVKLSLQKVANPKSTSMDDDIGGVP